KRPKWFTLVESKLLQDKSRRMVKKEWIEDANNMYTLRMSSKEILCDNRKKEMVEDTNSLGKIPSKSFRYLEKQEENRSSKSVKWLTKSRILLCLPRPVVKERKRVYLILTNMLEKMVHLETPISKEKEHTAGDVVIEDIDIGIIRQQKIGREMEETLKQQLQSNREQD
ncbi:23408_t:CDS:2, partial [Gigaspora rosea]